MALESTRANPALLAHKELTAAVQTAAEDGEWTLLGASEVPLVQPGAGNEGNRLLRVLKRMNGRPTRDSPFRAIARLGSAPSLPKGRPS